MKALAFVGVDLSERDMRFSFVWSRMAVIDARTERGFLRECCLPFEGFLEALCRVAVLKALPTDDEVLASGCAQTGEYMDWLKVTHEEEYEEMLATRGLAWGDAPSTAAETARAVCKTIEIIIHQIEESTNGADEGKLTPKEVQQWLRSKGLTGKSR